MNFVMNFCRELVHNTSLLFEMRLDALDDHNPPD